MVKTFQRGGRSTFICTSCGHRTRETGNNCNTDMCDACFDLSGLENMVMDGCFEPADRAQRDRLIELIGQRDGKSAADKVRREMADLFSA